MPDNKGYKELMSDIISKQSVILGPDIARIRAKNVNGLEISEDGKVISIKGEPREVLRNLVDEYVSLSGQIVKTALESVFKKHMDIEKIE